MSIFLPALAVAFAAFCLWLGVRIYNRRERRAKRTLTGLVVSFPFLYVASFGPACWLTSRDGSLYPSFLRIYQPLMWAADVVPPSWQVVLKPYATIGLPEKGSILIKHRNSTTVYRSGPR